MPIVIFLLIYSYLGVAWRVNFLTAVPEDLWDKYQQPPDM